MMRKSNVVEEPRSFAFQLMGQLIQMGAPVAFRGPAVFIALQGKYGNMSGVEWDSYDFGIDWEGQPGSAYVRSLLQKAAWTLGYRDVEVSVVKELADGKSAEFKFSQDVDFLFKVDVNFVKDNLYTELYQGEGVSFVGQSLAKLAADRVSSVSTGAVFRRIEDLLELYVLTFIWKGTKEDVVVACPEGFGSFSEFDGRQGDLMKAYGKYAVGRVVPEFDVVYQRVQMFIRGFKRNAVVRQWMGTNWV